MADRVMEALYVKGILAFLVPNLASMSIGVYEVNKGLAVSAKKNLSSSNI